MTNNGQNVNIPSLIAATQGVDNNKRNAATKQLEYLKDSHFAAFTLELCRILGSPQEPPPIRVGAGLLLKNCVGGARSEQTLTAIKERWAAQTHEMQNQLKRTILSVLSVPEVNARNTAVNVISNLALIETLSSWTDLIPTLIGNCTRNNNRDNHLMYSSLMCIGQIAEDPSTHSDLQQYSAKILECVANGMSIQNGKDAASVQSEAIKCLCEITQLIEPNMQIQEQRTIIFQMVCCGASSAQNEKLRLNSFQCIRRLLECYYHLFQPYMQSIFQISKTVIEKGVTSQKDEEVTKQAIEVWSTCADIELDINYEIEHIQTHGITTGSPPRKNFGFVNKALELLVPVYLNALLQQKDEFDEDEWTVRKAASCSLELFAHVAKNNILNYVLKFVEQNVSQSNWRGREAALNAFGHILQGPTPEKLTKLTSQILPIILRLMSDTVFQVRLSAIWAFGRICDLLPEAVGNKNVLPPIVKALNERNAICNKALWCISSLTRYYNESKINNSCIYSDNNAYNLICELLKRRNRSDSKEHEVIGVHEAINSIIFNIPQNSANKQMISALLPELVKQLCDSAKQSKTTNTDILMHKIAGLFGSIQVIVEKLGTDCLNQEMTGNIMQCCCQLLQKENDLVYEEALGCITHVARCVGDKFSVFLMEPKVQDLLVHAIRVPNIQIFRIGVGVISDVYTSCSNWISGNSNKLQAYSDRIVSELLGMLISSDYEMDSKGHIVDALTDILIAHGSYANRYSAMILDKCLEIGKLVPPKEADIDTMENFNEIRCSIIDTCRTCMCELAQANQIQNFAIYLPKIDEFFKAMAQDINRISIQVLESCIKLLIEAADFCDPNTKRKLQTKAVQQLLTKAGSMNHMKPELARDAKIAYQQISKTTPN